MSTGEKAIATYLRSQNIDFIYQVQLNNLPRYHYDFCFEYNGRSFLLEFDGPQHFDPDHFFHNGTLERFNRLQDLDILKTQAAVDIGVPIIHIDYTQINNMAEQINNAINTTPSCYFSNNLMYDYIISSLQPM